MRGRRRATPATRIRVPVGEGDARTHPQRHRTTRSTRPGRSNAAKTYPIHREPPGLHRAGDRGAGVRDRHQGRRPARALRARRQDRPLRRRRRRQDGHHPGAHQQRRQAARRLLGLRRRRRAHARGQRPLARDEGVGRHREGGAGLRADERAARRARPRRALGADGRRVLPRRGGQGRPPLHRQHLPVHAGELRGVGAARPHAVARSAISRRSRPTSASSRSASRRRRRARSPRCRRSTFPPTT